MNNLWAKEDEVNFFSKALEITSPEKLFYQIHERYFAYWPKTNKEDKSTLQSRNSLIGSYTEKWTKDLFSTVAESLNCFSVHGVICDEIGLTNSSPADVAICKNNQTIQRAEDILIIFEVKMSIVWNWELKEKKGARELHCVGDYNSHTAQPSFQRSDTMLKAIGKSLNIRISSDKASNKPIIIIGNTPIKASYHDKIDHLKQCGILQGFWSLNPCPLDSSNKENIKNTPCDGFYRFDGHDELKDRTENLLKEERNFFSSMQTKNRLGEFISIASREATDEKKAEKFLELIRS